MFPTGPFSTLVVDPPWKVKAGRPLGQYVMKDGVQQFGPRGTEARDPAYPTLSVADIAALPIGQIAADNAHLYLWTINKYLEDAFGVARAWGFRHSAVLTWAKQPMGGGLGGTFGGSTEFCLFCRRGTLPAKSRVGTTWFNWKRPYRNGYPWHSAKPPEFYTLVEAVSPGPYVDLFARTRRSGWISWGDEVDISLDALYTTA